MRCFRVALLQLLCIACTASLCMAAVPKKAVTGALFYNPKNIKLTYYPKATFVLPRCGSPMLSNNMDLKVDLDAATKGVVIAYNFDPNFGGDGAPFSFDVIDRISLNIKTGALSLRSYGASIVIDLATYLPSNELQTQNRCRNRLTTALGQSLFHYNYVTQKKSPVLVQGDALVTEALSVLSSAAAKFKTPQPICSTASPDNGAASLGAWVTYLASLRTLVGAKVSC